MADKNSRTDAVRKAVDQAFQSTAGSAGSATTQARDRAQDLVDELAQAAGKVREALDARRPPGADDIGALRSDLEALEKRVAKLEKPQRSSCPPSRRRRSSARSWTAASR